MRVREGFRRRILHTEPLNQILEHEVTYPRLFLQLGECTSCLGLQRCKGLLCEFKALGLAHLLQYELLGFKWHLPVLSSLVENILDQEMIWGMRQKMYQGE